MSLNICITFISSYNICPGSRKIMIEINKGDFYFKYVFNKNDWIYFINCYENNKTFELRYHSKNYTSIIRCENRIISNIFITNCYIVKIFDKNKEIASFLHKYI